jgi:aryl-alcohol dehydrogenase-like predicted oxidoreductase
VPIVNTSLCISRIAFGTSSLHHLGSVRERSRLISMALDSGITHFDTSPYYGFGLAEQALSVLGSRGPEVSLATKVGLYPPGGAQQSQIKVLARKIAGKFVRRLSKPIVDWSVARARRSLDESLQRLQRERVEILFLHEPDFELFAAEEWLRWLQAERDRIGAVGVSGEASQVLPFTVAGSPFAQVVQTRDSLVFEQAAPLRRAGVDPQITFGHLAAGSHRTASTTSAEEIVRRTIARFPRTALLLSTRNAEHIRDWTRAA